MAVNVLIQDAGGHILKQADPSYYYSTLPSFMSISHMLLKHKGYRNKYQYIKFYELNGVTSFDICIKKSWCC